MGSLPLVSPSEGENFLNPFHTQSPGLSSVGEPDGSFQGFPFSYPARGRGVGQLGLPTASGHFHRIHVVLGAGALHMEIQKSTFFKEVKYHIGKSH